MQLRLKVNTCCHIVNTYCAICFARKMVPAKRTKRADEVSPADDTLAAAHDMARPLLSPGAGEHGRNACASQRIALKGSLTARRPPFHPRRWRWGGLDPGQVSADLATAGSDFVECSHTRCRRVQLADLLRQPGTSVTALVPVGERHRPQPTGGARHGSPNQR